MPRAWIFSDGPDVIKTIEEEKDKSNPQLQQLGPSASAQKSLNRN